MTVLKISFRKMGIYERRNHRRTYSEPESRNDGSGADFSSMEIAHSLRKEADPASEEKIDQKRRAIAYAD